MDSTLFGAKSTISAYKLNIFTHMKRSPHYEDNKVNKPFNVNYGYLRTLSG